jgi:carboxyl-terminal processing protease
MIVVGLSLVIFLAGLNLGLNHQASAKINPDEFDEYMTLFSQIISYVQTEYVDEDKTDMEALFTGAIDGMLSELDPHSQWMPVRRFKEFQVETKGHFGGLGIRIDIVDDWLTVVQPLEDTPAMEAGLRAGDKIIEIEGETTRDITIEEAVNKLRGPEGSPVTITVLRQLRDDKSGRMKAEKEEYTIVREDIKIPSIWKKKMLPGKIGYVRLIEFKEDAGKELEESLVELEEQGMEGCILDLRYNQGGLLPVAIEVSDIFLPRGREIVRIRERPPAEEQVYRARSRGHTEFPLVVLVNHWSASASEIVAGAIQDWHRGIIMGPRDVRTFGKGSVQTVQPLRDGSGLKLTTARYYTPDGRSIHGTGIKPDIEVPVDDMHEYALSALGRLGDPPPWYTEQAEDESEEVSEGEDEEMEPVTEEAVINEIQDEEIDPSEIFIEHEPMEEVSEDAEEEVWDLMVAQAMDVLKSYRILAGVTSEKD